MLLRCLNRSVLIVSVFAASSAYSADTLIGSAFDTHFPGGQNAYGASLALQDSIGLGGFIVGISDTQYPIGSLSELDLDGYRTGSARLSLSGGLSIGEADARAEENLLFKARLNIDSQIDPKWLVHLGYQYIDLALIHGNLASASVEYKPDPAVGIKLGGGYAINGTVAENYENLEINHYARTRLFAGVILGRTGYDPATLGEVSLVERLFQVYAGAAVPTSFGTVSLTVDSLSLEGASRQTLRLGFSRQIAP